eukprot:gnl/TRDRNA2_/TRDRNA2_54384_c0_seq1.p1 gnl/TRDRNA2_/TRDRNA2_54384_c0~~gnl/TRDRNA2_/TRDRNA2_54384_c0_seq1.p1  ORF type:complete len:522 (+),score=87.75 gnl/TRDRNA2_/TRDRNA2_54384_c0_seq1:121-1686(+)
MREARRRSKLTIVVLAFAALADQGSTTLRKEERPDTRNCWCHGCRGCSWGRAQRPVHSLTVEGSRRLSTAAAKVATASSTTVAHPGNGALGSMLDRLSLQDRRAVGRVAAAITKARSIIVMAGAGVSVSAGIPDFRSPTTGLYNKLKQDLNLPFPEAVFNIHYFKKNPEPFYRVCKELFPEKFRPTPTHFFFRLLYEKGKLLRLFSQNIDSLETHAGVPKSHVVTAHGNFDSASCITTGDHVDMAEFKEAVMTGKSGAHGWEALAQRHGGLVKPDIVFFGESMPKRFNEMSEADFPKADLLIVCGTSLAVEPFASLINQVNSTVSRVLLNRNRVGEASGTKLVSNTSGPFFGANGAGFCFNDGGRDMCLLGDCDDVTRLLAEQLGWANDLQRLIAGTGDESNMPKRVASPEKIRQASATAGVDAAATVAAETAATAVAANPKFQGLRPGFLNLPARPGLEARMKRGFLQRQAHPRPSPKFLIQASPIVINMHTATLAGLLAGSGATFVLLRFRHGALSANM